MPLSDAERRTLTATVGRCRRLLEEEAHDQLERIYGFSREGTIRPLEGLRLSAIERTISEELREWHRHLASLASGTPRQRQSAALRKMAEETAFTFLHRLAAIRMAEERGVLRSCLRDGFQSDGFRLFYQFSGGALGHHEEAYRVFLERIFDEVAEDLPALFDRREPRSLVFPRAKCLEDIVRELTVPELSRAWADDETIGWIYQDFHSAEERQKLRKRTKVPRNSHELAIRNQLFTPRWVVEFLTDNTLGRLWVDMTEGATEIAKGSAYLVPHEVTSRVAPKDVRDIRVIDPACGSGHFLLYAFDLLERIYLEAWRCRIGLSSDRTPLWEEYQDWVEFSREVPALILRHNLFGVDIDPRPIQVAALALWLRAQRSWKDIPHQERPQIGRMNLVCAESMPGEQEQLESFASGLRPAVLGDLVREVWHSMRHVDETGLLMRIERRIRDLIQQARNGWNGTATIQVLLFEESPNWEGRRHDLSTLARDEAARFWSEAEERVVQTLEAYAGQAAESDRVLRRLFAEDAERGFAFIDLSRAQYDVVLMNPPFGQPGASTKDQLDKEYPACGHEIYAMFFQRALELLEDHGKIGAITERDWLGQGSLRGLREQVFGELGAVVVGADLGYGVLEARVETAAVIVDKQERSDSVAHWFRLVTAGQKEAALFGAISAVRNGQSHPYSHLSAARRFRRLREGAYAYWMSDDLLDRYTSLPTLQGAKGEAVVGTQATPDYRFLRLAWEISPTRISLEEKWPRFAKGGEFRPFWDDIHLVLNWEDNGTELASNSRAYIRNPNYYGRRGVTWPNRSNLPISPRCLPDGCVFGHKGPTAFGDIAVLPCMLATMTARPFHLVLSPWLNTADVSPNAISKSYEVGVVNGSGWPVYSKVQAERLHCLAGRAGALVRIGQLEEDSTGETCVTFATPPVLLTGRDLPLPQGARRRVEDRELRFSKLADLTAEIDEIVAEAYGFTEHDYHLMNEELESAVARFPEPETDPDDDLFRRAYLTKEQLPGELLPGGLHAEVDVRVEHRRGRQTKALRNEESLCRLFELPPRRFAAIRRRLDLLREEDLKRCAADIVSWAVGVAFGRWDFRLLDHPEWIPDWPDPFGPLPRCPLGQLVDARGLPATPQTIASEAWLAARTDACSLPAVETDRDGKQWLLDANGVRSGPAEIDTRAYPVTVAWEGLLQDDILDDDTPVRHTDDLSSRTSQVLELVYGESHSKREAELAQALGAESLGAWLRRPDGFFADHLGRYSKSRRKAPVYWPISTPSGGFTLWLYYPRISGDMLANCVNRLRENQAALEREEAHLLAARRAEALPPEDQTRLDRIRVEIRERDKLYEALRELSDGEFEPHLDDGAVINAAPLRRWFRHRTWREAAEKVWAEVQSGEHDWSHLALWLRRNEVLARCRTERDLAIAHGREDLFVPPPESERRRGRRRKAAQQLTISDDAGGEDV